MWAKSRCSIRFHLLVPGGRCATVTARPVSSAKRCSSRFHSRTRAPVLPPQSALRRPRAGAVAARGVGGDDQPVGLVVARLAEFAPPAPDALDREGRRV